MKKWLILIFAVMLVTFVASCSDDDECPTCPPDTQAPLQAYVGSATCGTSGCHDAKYAMFLESGHPYKLTEVTGGVGPVYPWDSEHPSGTTSSVVSVDGPPDATPWTDYAYVIGGYGWKARFVLPTGKIYTATATNQLNLWAGTGDTDKWVNYHVGEDRSYNYNCFKCHTTGASETGSWPAGTTGFGTFAFGGVQCEECHGQGAQHASDPARFEMVVNTSSTACGECHTRDPQNRVAVSGSTPVTTWIRHHEQYDEMIHSPHAAVGCNECHDPHASVVYDDEALGMGVKRTCESCHTGYDYAGNLQHYSGLGAPTCVDCHMPKAAKSARVDPNNPYVADIASHTFTISTADTNRTAMWTSDGKFLKQDEFGRGAITLDFACYSCHKDVLDEGGAASRRILSALAAKADGMHTP